MEKEVVVFCNEDGTPTGEVGPKLESHTAHTKLHLAFSCYLFRKSDNKFLMTRRALSKRVWPGVWTNSVCGHLAPKETMENAIRRRAQFELGLEKIDDIKNIIPDYIYTTTPFNGIVDHEFCPVFVGCIEDDPKPNPEEVEDWMWVDWNAFVRMMVRTPDKMSWWAKDQYKLLKDHEPFRSLEK